ncbi:hypothetical protein KJ590_03430, partial [Patescibacteria group bacterium]|nr:hypothetical protein [Patescibacteria group bacterium]
TGWLGLISYLALFGAAGWALIKNLLPEPFDSAQGKLESKADIAADPSTRAADATLAPAEGEARPAMAGRQGIRRNYYLPIILISLLAAYLVQNFFIFDSFVSYLMLFFVLAMISNICYTRSLSVIPAKAGIQVELGPGSRLKAGMTTKVSFVLFTIFIIFSLYSFNLKPLYASYLANQILSLPPADAARFAEASARRAQSAPLLKDALALNSFASEEIVYQAALDYIIKINQQPALAQNEEFYNIAASELSKIIERSPNRARNYIVLAWLNLYFSNQHSDRINESIILAGKTLELSPNKKDAYLILAAGYALSNQPLPAQEIILRASAIDGKMGEEVRAYWEKLK